LFEVFRSEIASRIIYNVDCMIAKRKLVRPSRR